MGLLDILLGRSRAVGPDLDRLFALPSAAVGLEAAAGFRPTGQGAVCFATVEGAAFERTHREIRALLDADAGRTPVELVPPTPTATPGSSRTAPRGSCRSW
ncbi:hypothetical protein STENM327S_03982 [Streptomyces tendae]